MGSNNSDRATLTPARLRIGDAKVAYDRLAKNPICMAVKQEKSHIDANRIKRIVDHAFSEHPLPVDFPLDLWDPREALYNSLIRTASGSAVDLVSRFFVLFYQNKPYTDRPAVMEYINKELLGDLWDEYLKVDVEQASKVASRSLTWPFSKVSAKLLSIFAEIPQPKVDFDAAIDWLFSRFGTMIPMPISATHGGGNASDFGSTPMDVTTTSGPWAFAPNWYPSDSIEDAKRKRLATYVHRWIMSDVQAKVKIFRSGRSCDVWSQWNKRVDFKGEGDPNMKSLRAVLGVEKWEAIIGKTFAAPIVNKLRQIAINGVRPFCGLLGDHYVDQELWRMLQTAKAKGLTLIGGDISKFDSSKSQELTLKIGAKLSTHFRHEIDRMVFNQLLYSTYMRHGTVTPDGVVKPQPISQASGSFSTLLFNSLYLSVVLIAGHFNKVYKLINYVVLGDDFVMLAEGADPSVVSDWLSECGLEAAKEKQFYVQGHAHFLQKLYSDKFYGGVASVSRVIGRIISPEHMWKHSEETRTLAAMMALGGLLPIPSLMLKAVNLVKEADPLRLHEGKTWRELAQASDLTAVYKQRGQIMQPQPLLLDILDRARRGESYTWSPAVAGELTKASIFMDLS